MNSPDDVVLETGGDGDNISITASDSISNIQPANLTGSQVDLYQKVNKMFENTFSSGQTKGSTSQSPVSQLGPMEFETRREIRTQLSSMVGENSGTALRSHRGQTDSVISHFSYRKKILDEVESINNTLRQPDISSLLSKALFNRLKG